jgi:hypothetical protein
MDNHQIAVARAPVLRGKLRISRHGYAGASSCPFSGQHLLVTAKAGAPLEHVHGRRAKPRCVSYTGLRPKAQSGYVVGLPATQERILAWCRLSLPLSRANDQRAQPTWARAPSSWAGARGSLQTRAAMHFSLRVSVALSATLARGRCWQVAGSKLVGSVLERATPPSRSSRASSLDWTRRSSRPCARGDSRSRSQTGSRSPAPSGCPTLIRNVSLTISCERICKRPQT